MLLAFVAAASLPYDFFDGFAGGFQLFDDEGTLLITLRDLSHGLRLYDEVYALYGPFYYLSVGGLFTDLHLPLTHDAFRVVSTVFRIVSAASFATLTYRLARSEAGGLFTFIALLVVSHFMLESPTHPQEVCLLMLGALPHLALTIERRPDRSLPAAAAVGMLLAALCLTKINVGATATIAMALAAARSTRRCHAQRIVAGALLAITLALPAILMAPLLSLTWVMRYLAFAVATVAATLIPLFLLPGREVLTGKHWLVGLASFCTTSLLVVGATLLRGSSIHALLDAVLLQNLGFARAWHLEAPIAAGSVDVALAALVASALVCRSLGPRHLALGPHVAVFSRLVVGCFGMALLALGLCGVIGPGWAAVCVFQLLPPFSFLLLLPSTSRPVPGLGPASVALLSALMVLYAFPVAGGQIVVAETCMISLLPVLVSDALVDVRMRYHRMASVRRSLVVPFSVVGWIVVLAVAGQTRSAWLAWHQQVPSQLPGASLIRAPAPQISAIREILSRLGHCPAFYTFPGMSSFYLWSGEASPTALNNNDALALLSTAQQDHVVAELARVPKLCVLFSPDLLRLFDRGQVAHPPPILRYVQENFEPRESFGHFILLGPKER